MRNEPHEEIKLAQRTPGAVVSLQAGRVLNTAWFRSYVAFELCLFKPREREREREKEERERERER